MFFADADGVPAPLHPRHHDGSARTPDGHNVYDLSQAVTRFGLTEEQLRSQYLRVIADFFPAAGGKRHSKRRPRPRLSEAEYDEVRHRLEFPELGDEEYRYVQADCQRRGLDMRQVFVVKTFDKALNRVMPRICPRIEALRAIATRTGAYVGIDEMSFEYGPDAVPLYAVAHVYRLVQGHRAKFSARVAWAEYAPLGRDGEFWKASPEIMLGNCAEAAALRKAFPDECGGLYVREEFAKDRTGGAGGCRGAGGGAQAPSASEPADDPDVAMDRTMFEKELWEMGISDAGRRSGIILQFRAKWGPLFSQDQAAFYRRALREVKKAPTVFGVAAEG